MRDGLLWTSCLYLPDRLRQENRQSVGVQQQHPPLPQAAVDFWYTRFLWALFFSDLSTSHLRQEKSLQNTRHVTETAKNVIKGLRQNLSGIFCSESLWKCWKILQSLTFMRLMERLDSSLHSSLLIVLLLSPLKGCGLWTNVTVTFSSMKPNNWSSRNEKHIYYIL